MTQAEIRNWAAHETKRNSGRISICKGLRLSDGSRGRPRQWLGVSEGRNLLLGGCVGRQAKAIRFGCVTGGPFSQLLAATYIRSTSSRLPYTPQSISPLHCFKHGHRLVPTLRSSHRQLPFFPPPRRLINLAPFLDHRRPGVLLKHMHVNRPEPFSPLLPNSLPPTTTL